MAIDYYCVGFTWRGNDPENQLPRFLKDKIWENGFDDKYHAIVKEIPVGSKIAAKTTYTRKVEGKTLSVLDIRAIGTVRNNPGDGKILQVDWEEGFNPFSLDGRGAYRSTISRVKQQTNIDLIFGNKKNKEGKALEFSTQDIVHEFPLNQILFGPPGTGKTYNTISKAVSIIDGVKEDALFTYYENRQGVKDRFDELKSAGQIVFCTFHQSMTYEDFVEGIKPVMEDDDEDEGEKTLEYEIQDGIFKRVCVYAKYDFYKSSFAATSSSISRAEYFNLAYEELIATIEEKLETEASVPFKTKTGSMIYVHKVSKRSNLKAKHSEGQREYGVSKPRLLKLFNHFKNLNDIKSVAREFRAIIGGANSSVYWAILSPLYEIYDRIKNQTEIKPISGKLDYESIRSIVNSFSISKEKMNESSPERYVLIIDEINRGNVAQIFGELITLIEEDKRLGRAEALEVMLPYNKEYFGVPPNLYILGTMNTADRSVESLDTALRRRFNFVEMAPQPKLISPSHMMHRFLWANEEYKWNNPIYSMAERKLLDLLGASQKVWEDKKAIWEKMEDEGESPDQISLFSDSEFTGINYASILEAINIRIEKLLDKDHRIGHSYFIGATDLSALKLVFANKVLPLLQEYFFGDYGKIGLILGSGFFENQVAQTKEKVNVFASFNDYDSDELNQRTIYKLKDVGTMNDPDFLAAIDLLVTRNVN